MYKVTVHLEGAPAVEHDEDFDSFYEAAFGRIAGQLFVVTGDLQDAEDVTQEAFARASIRWSRLRTYDLPEAWVRRVETAGPDPVGPAPRDG